MDDENHSYASPQDAIANFLPWPRKPVGGKGAKSGKSPAGVIARAGKMKGGRGGKKKS